MLKVGTQKQDPYKLENPLIPRFLQFYLLCSTSILSMDKLVKAW